MPTYFMQQGIRYDDLPEEEKEQWDELEWDDQGDIPESVAAQEMNRSLFNEDAVDKVLEQLMTRGQKVAGGDRLGKTIIFAKNQKHADFIQTRFDANYPKEKGSFARTITFKVEYAQSLIDDFSFQDPPKAPHIAISVDMLDTGIDVPEVLNLVFFKPVRSKTKFWQMVGRGTRLSPNVFAPGEDKRFFYVFDVCGNLEFFGNDGGTVEGSTAKPLRQSLFESRLELIAELDNTVSPDDVRKAAETGLQYGDPTTNLSVRQHVVAGLHSEVEAMNVDNFIVRPKRESVEKFKQSEAWISLNPDAMHELQTEVSGLPSEQELGEEEAKRFDLLMLKLQLALLRKSADFEGLRKRLMELAELISDKHAIPQVKAQLELLGEIQTDDWWQDVTVPMLESARRKLRHLIRLIDHHKKQPVYTNFEDIIEEGTEFEMGGVGGANEFALFRQKARSFLREHEDIPAVYKRRMNIQLTTEDIDALEATMVELGSSDVVQQAADEADGLGLFARSLVGLAPEAATNALSEFTAGSTMTANQITFAKLIVERLVEHGIAEPKNFYDPPFTDVAPQGPQGLFSDVELKRLQEVLARVRNSAVVTRN
mgnify:CR=1 FL=1